MTAVVSVTVAVSTMAAIVAMHMDHLRWPIVAVDVLRGEPMAVSIHSLQESYGSYQTEYLKRRQNKG